MIDLFHMVSYDFYDMDVNGLGKTADLAFIANPGLKPLYDVLIVGGGVVGCAVARVLSRSRLDVLLCEACADVSMGASRANSAVVHAGYDAKPGTLMARYNALGNALYTDWCRDLDVPLVRCGSLVIAFGAEDEAKLDTLFAYGRENGVPGLALLSGEAAREREPALNPDVTRALWAPTGGVTSPYQMTIACWENAVANGLDTLLSAPVTAIAPGDAPDAPFTVAVRGLDAPINIKARLIVNAAGVRADDIARMVGDDSFTILPRKGEYLLLDREANNLTRVVFQTPSRLGKGILVSPTADGPAFVGPTALDVEDKDDTSTTRDAQDILRSFAPRSVPGLDLRMGITQFAGVRAVADTGDFVIRPSAKHPRFLHAAGICSPGLTAAPAIAEAVAGKGGLVERAGLALEDDPAYDPKRPDTPSFRCLDDAARAALIARDPAWGRVVCRCETVSEAEIVSAIRRGGRTLDGVKRRTRAGMGRCQGGFCAPRVMALIHRETGIPMERLTKNGGASRLLAGALREEARGDV